ncbi:HAD domain-containing protein [Roseateles sp. So40a]|uniref:HAD domain-containing protein n=1 Tax=Roseateles sp. So40a TaxID=3400226 RepID=UPI003A8B4005
MTTQPAPSNVIRPTLFLDIDDTLCLNSPLTGHDALLALRATATDAEAPGQSEFWSSLFHRLSVDVLECVMREHRPRVVITSSWLLHFDDQMLKAVFHRTGLSSVAESFHDHWDAQQDRGMTRLEAITRWLENHHRGEPIAIIDDIESGTGLRGSHMDRAGCVILCEPNVGLHAQHVSAINTAFGAAHRFRAASR